MSDLDYIYQLSLPGFKKQGKHFNFKCVLCGDSKKSSKKQRGWFLNKHNKWFYYCFNCGASLSLVSFLKEYDQDLYDSYKKERFKKNKSFKPKEKTIEETIDDSNKIILPSLKLPKISELDSDHKAKIYFKKRMIPEKFYSYFYYVDEFKKWINTILPDKFESTQYDEGRIIIPFHTRKGKIFAVAGRSLEPNAKIRYLTIKFNENHPKIFGLERIDVNKPIFILEGQFDSLFVPNSLAIGGSDLNFNNLDKISDRKNITFVYDNEPRNKEIIDKIEKAINGGFNISLIPKNYKKYGKDINQMVENNLTVEEINDIIKKNTFNGTKAKLKLTVWKEIVTKQSKKRW